MVILTLLRLQAIIFVYEILFNHGGEILVKYLDLSVTAEVLKDIGSERIRQHVTKGPQEENDWGDWLSILGEEFGEVCQAIQWMNRLPYVKESDSTNLYEELIHLSAVSTKMAELLRVRGIH